MTLAAAVAAPPPPALAPGFALAPGYEVRGHLHRGQALDVYDAWSAERECRCVVKAVRPDRLDRPRDRERLLHEGRLLLALAHPHIVRAYEVIEDPHPLVVLETLGGETLARVVERTRRGLAADDLIGLGRQLCSAIGYLHRHGHLHLDLKPANLVAGDDGRVRVLDLSLARPPGVYDSGIGTRGYLPPEQARGGWLGPAADVWGIGAVLSAAGARVRLRRLPGTLRALVDACLEPVPDARPRLGELASGLAALDRD